VPVRGRPFLKGQSGNPRGRPKRGASLSEHLRHQLQQVVGEDGRTTRAEALAATLVRLACDGDVQAAKLVLSYTDGLPVQALPRVEPPDDGRPLAFTLVLDRANRDGPPELPP
jgi:hypothetical protein